MKYRFNKRLNKNVSEVGFGAWQLGGKGTWSYMSHEEGLNLVKAALDKGINFFDTAPNYADGNSEIILGEALKGIRDQVIINTKVGHGPLDAWEFTKAGIRNSVERSLKKLQTDYVDSVILHNPDNYIFEGHNELIDELIKLKEEGKTKLIGYSIDSLDHLKTVLNNGIDFDTIEIMFNMIHQEPKALFDEVKKRNIFLIIKVPLDSGWLTGKYNQDSTFTDIRSRWTKADIKLRSEIVDKIKEIVKTDDLVIPALSYILHYDAVTSVIPGMKSEKYLNVNVKASDNRLSHNLIKQLVELYSNYISKFNLPW